MKKETISHSDWEAAITELISEQLEMTYSDAHGTLESKEFFVQQAWTIGHNPKQAFNHISTKSNWGIQIQEA